MSKIVENAITQGIMYSVHEAGVSTHRTPKYTSFVIK
jgi:hypothetical protein